jgi:hypothetical protein
VQLLVEVLLLLPAVEQYQLLEAEQVLRLEVDQAAEVEVLPVEEDLVDEHLAVAGLVDVLLAVEALVVLPLAVEGLAAEDLVVEVLEDAVLVVVEAFLPPVVEEVVLLAAVGEEVLQPVAVVDLAEVVAGVLQPAAEEVQHLVAAAARLPLLVQAGLVEVLVVGWPAEVQQRQPSVIFDLVLLAAASELDLVASTERGVLESAAALDS